MPASAIALAVICRPVSEKVAAGWLVVPETCAWPDRVPDASSPWTKALAMARGASARSTLRSIASPTEPVAVNEPSPRSSRAV